MSGSGSALSPEETSGFPSALGPDTYEPRAIYSISLPAEVFENVAEKGAGVVFSFYSTSILFPLRINLTDVDLENSTYQTIGSSVISATLAEHNITNLKNPIQITMEIIVSVSCIILSLCSSLACPQQQCTLLELQVTCTIFILTQNWSNPLCVSWDFRAANGSGNWSAAGCDLQPQENNGTVVVCLCRHLTNFGILVV